MTDSGTDRQTDGRTDGRTGVSKERAIAYMLSRAKNSSSYRPIQGHDFDIAYIQLPQVFSQLGLVDVLRVKQRSLRRVQTSQLVVLG